MNDIDKNGRPGRSELSRRHLIRRAAGIGLLGTGFDRLMNVRWIDPAAAATYDPKKYAGTKISILMVGGEGEDRAIADLVPELEAETGIKLSLIHI